jgi:uncharacterized membrane protein
MSTEQDRYWDDLGIAWVAVDPNSEAIAAQLDSRLRSQALRAKLLVATGVPLAVAMLALAGFTLYAGFNGGAWNFLVRGIALLVLSGMTGLAAWSQRFDAAGQLNSLAGKMDQTIARSRKLHRAAGLGLTMCGVAAVAGLAGYFIRVRQGHPPAMSPLEPLALLALMAIAICIYMHYSARDLERLEYLRRTLASESPRG